MGAVFITGGTGFVGGKLLKRLVEEDHSGTIYALCRARDARDVQRRARETFFRLFHDGALGIEMLWDRVVWLRGDMTEPGLGLSSTARDRITHEVDTIYHAAASTDFELPRELAFAINVEGVRSLIELALATENLKRFVHISTAYVVGKRNGSVRPDELPGPKGPFNNSYEESKAASERLLREHMMQLPITIVRPSIVVGDSATGRTYNFNVLYYPLKMIYRGKLPFVPARRTTTLDIVPVDYVVNASIALARSPKTIGGTYHVAAGDDAIDVRALGVWLNDFYPKQRQLFHHEAQEPVRVISLLRWRFTLWWLRRKLRGLALEKLNSFCIYLPYLLTEKHFVTDETLAVIGDEVVYRPILSYLEYVASYAVAREWGRRVSWDPALLSSGNWSGASGEQLVADEGEL